MRQEKAYTYEDIERLYAEQQERRHFKKVEIKEAAKRGLVGGATIGGIHYTKDEIKKMAESIKLEEQAAKVKPPQPEKKFTPNPYIAHKEKTELATMLMYRQVGSDTKHFIDSRHEVIYKVMYGFLNRPYPERLTPAVLIEAIEKQNRLELAGGADFINDIFRGLPKDR